MLNSRAQQLYSLTHGGSGGGSSKDLAEMTFMNAGEVIFQRPVYIGDDCPDPVGQTRIATPTKESTAQYNYTFNGWATTAGGSADSKALLNITEARTVHAAFKSSVRKYTVKYYDGSTLIHSEQVAYGGSSDYTYDKPGYAFNGWTPAPTNITGDLACYGEWVESDEITDSWDEIVAAVNDGSYADKYQVGYYKPLDLGSEGIVNMQIVGMNLDKTSDGKTTGLSFVAKELLNTPRSMKGTKSSDKYTTFLSSDLYAYLTGTIKPMLPTSLQAGIKTVQKTYRSPNDSSTLEQEIDLWVPSAYEIGFTDGEAPADAESTGVAYSVIYNSNESRIKYAVNDPATAQQWWLRSGVKSPLGVTGCVNRVYGTGTLDSYYGFSAYYERYICLGFCI